MAVAPKWSTQTYAGRYDTDEHRAYRLPKTLTDELEAIARGYDTGDAGLKSLFVADSQRQAGITHGGGKPGSHGESDSLAEWQRSEQDAADRSMLEAAGAALDYGHQMWVPPMVGGPVRMFDPERWCDSKLEVEKADFEPPFPIVRKSSYRRRERARAALDVIRQLPDGAALLATLHVVYGWPEPFVGTLPMDVVRRWNDDAVHPLAALARYTDATEAIRQELIDASADDAMKDWAWAPTPEDGHLFYVSTKNGRRRARFTAVEAEDVFRENRALSARHWADRNLTSTDAIRWALRPHETRDEDVDDSEHQARVARHRARRERFITDVKLDAGRMLKDASEALRDAWRVT